MRLFATLFLFLVLVLGASPVKAADPGITFDSGYPKWKSPQPGDSWIVGSGRFTLPVGMYTYSIWLIAEDVDEPLLQYSDEAQTILIGPTDGSWSAVIPGIPLHDNYYVWAMLTIAWQNGTVDHYYTNVASLLVP